MAGPAASIAHVPLREALPRDYAAAEDELRRLAHELERHPVAAGRIAWHWYPERTEPSQASEPGTYLLLVDTTVTLYDTGDDWLELSLDVAWLAPAELTVSAAVEVACWCLENHNMHQVRHGRWHVADSDELVEAFAAGTAMLIEVLASGPLQPHPWRVQGGLPDVPDTSR
jgi:hypothetical protein